jgi:hypothetical protein
VIGAADNVVARHLTTWPVTVSFLIYIEEQNFSTIYFEKYSGGAGTKISEYSLKPVRLKAHIRRSCTKRKVTRHSNL